jgi:hypothetical protein
MVRSRASMSRLRDIVKKRGVSKDEAAGFYVHLGWTLRDALLQSDVA